MGMSRESVRGSLLSVLFLVLSTAPVVAQGAGFSHATDRTELVRNLLGQIEVAQRTGDGHFLKSLAAMAYAGGPLDDLRDADLPPTSLARLPSYLYDRVRELETDNLRLLVVGANRIRGVRPGDVVRVGWWGCTMSYLSDVGRCWDIYANCMDPGPQPDGIPNQDWCRTLFNACLENARSRYDRCKSDDPLAY